MNLRKLKYDVVVVGGGTAGVGAAIGAAQTGARTLLVERDSYFGGQATQCSLPAFCGFFTQSDPYEQVIGGVGQIVLNELSGMGMYENPVRTPGTGNVIVLVDSEAVKYVLDKCLVNAKVDRLLHTHTIKATTSGETLRSIECVDDSGCIEVEGSAFVDASGEANLTAMAGGAVVLGGDNGNFQAATMNMRIGGVSPEADVHPGKIAKAVLKAKEAGIKNLTKELSTVLRLPGSQDVLLIHADEDVNGLDSFSLTQAEISGREQTWAYLEALKRYLPGFEKAYLVQTGPKIGIRETRHIVGEYTLCADDLKLARRHSDAIARAAWPGEAHHKPGIPNEYYHIHNKSFFDIPLRSIKAKGLENLWAAGRTIACDTTAFVSIRVTGTSFGTGHAAGVAAGVYVNKKDTTADAVRCELIRQDAII